MPRFGIESAGFYLVSYSVSNGDIEQGQFEISRIEVVVVIPFDRELDVICTRGGRGKNQGIISIVWWGENQSVRTIDRLREGGDIAHS